MAFSKAPLYTPKDQITSGYARALSHPARLEIIRKLSNEGTCTVKALNLAQPISQEAMSYHLKILRKAQLVSCKEKFPHTYYSLEKENLIAAKQKLEAFFQIVICDLNPNK